MSYERIIQFIQEGEPVSPGTPNRPLSQLDQNIRYLYDIVQAAALGSTVYARAQTVASTLQVGQPVYYNATTSQFEAAFAAAVSDAATGYLVVPDQAQVWGIVAAKLNATKADILLFGYAKIDIADAIGTEVNGDGSVPAGTWYLSGVSAGVMTRQLPPVTIPVCKTDNAGGVYVNPRFVDFLENHRHYAFNLTMLPAGDVTPPTPGDPHTILNPDFDLPGWLPADHASFNDLAPAGAKFGYNLSQDLTLKNLYPPVPLQSAAIVMQRPSVYDTSTTHRWYGQQLMSDLVVIDRNGIWWMSDCYDEVPWPTELDTSATNSEVADFCDPLSRNYSLRFYYTRVGFATDNATVTSLTSLDPRLQITCAGQANTTASTGNLEIDLNLQFMLGNTTTSGSQVLKQFNPATNVFNSGPVCEGVYAASNNVILTGSNQTISGNTVFQGLVGIGVLTQTTQELESQLVRLNGVTEENYPVLYLGMPNDTTTDYVVKFNVPADAPVNASFRLRLRLLGRSAGTLPPLTAEYYTAARPTNGLLTPITITQSYSALAITTTATITSNQAVEALSDPVAVTPGDIIYIKITRTPAATLDTYSGEVGVMQQIGVLTAD
jgi:hypothetical protein